MRASPSPASTAVFLGPSLPREQARALLDADYLPPARKGDIYRLIPSGVRTIVLIDGVFHTTPSVWQRELLDAIDEGIQVLGASSMGALRAAELHRHGMIGQGTIFEWYRDGVIDGDDEVALWHASEEHDYRPLSEPLVNLRCTLLQAVEDGCLTEAQARGLTAYAKQLYYPQRSYRALLISPIVASWPPDRQARLEHYFSTNSVDLKRLDAIGLLRRCADEDSHERDGLRPASARPSRNADAATPWRYERLLMTGFITPAGVVTGEQILRAARRDSALVRRTRRLLSRRFFQLGWARQNGVSCPEAVLTSFMREREEGQRLRNPAEWLRANGLTQERYRMLSAEYALAEWMSSQGEAAFGLKRSFVLEWAGQNGVFRAAAHRSDSLGPSTKGLERWIVDQGPGYFGQDWRFDVALLQELQLTGKAAELIELVAAG
jgi:hypothetical protein